MTRIHLLHTNDFHNHLSDAQAEVIHRAKSEYENVLLLDSGDAISAGNVGVRPGGEPILMRMSDTGYDAMTLGNREFHVSDALLRMKISKAKFPILCANLRWREDRGETPPTVPHLIKTMPNGLRVGIFGLTVPMVTPRMTARLVSAYVFDDPITTANGQIALLRPEVDALIALTHIGMREDERLAAACPELDLIIGGHSHNVLQELKRVGGVPIAQAGWFGHWFGEIFLAWETQGGRPQVSGRLIPLKEK